MNIDESDFEEISAEEFNIHMEEIEKEMEQLCAENEALKAVMAEKDMRIAELEQERHETVADYVVSVMDENNIDNFSINSFSTSDGRKFDVTFQFVNGESPAEQLERLKREHDALVGKLRTENEQLKIDVASQLPKYKALKCVK